MSPRSEWEQPGQRLEQAAVAGDSKAVEAIVGPLPPGRAQEIPGAGTLSACRADDVAEGRRGLADKPLITCCVAWGARWSSERHVQDYGGRDRCRGHPPATSPAGGTWSRPAGLPGWLSRVPREERVSKRPSRALRGTGGARPRAGSPLAIRAEFFLVCCDYLTQQFSRGLARAERLVREVPEPALPGSSRERVPGSGRAGGEPQAATGRGPTTMRRRWWNSAETSEKENVAGAACLVGKSFSFLGREQQASAVRLPQALRTLPRLRDSAARANLFMIACGLGRARRHGYGGARLRAGEGPRGSSRPIPWRRSRPLPGWHGCRSAKATGSPACGTLQEARARVSHLEDVPAAPPPPGRSGDDRRRDAGEGQSPPGGGSPPLRRWPSIERTRISSFPLFTLLERGRAQRQDGRGPRGGAGFRSRPGALRPAGQAARPGDFRLPFLDETDAVFDEMISPAGRPRRSGSRLRLCRPSSHPGAAGDGVRALDRRTD